MTGEPPVPSVTPETLGAALELQPDASVVVDQAGVVVRANARVEELLGRPVGEVVGAAFEALLAPADREQQRFYLLAYFASPRPRPLGAPLVLRGAGPNGAVKPLDVALQPIGLGARRLTLASLRDMTERRGVELALASARADLDTVFASLPEGMLLVDRAGVVARCNARGAELLGVAPAALVGAPAVRVIRARDPESLAPLQLGACCTPAPAEAPPTRHRGLLERPGGELLPIEITVAQIRAAHGEHEGWALVLRDRTREHEEERALVEAERVRAQLDCAPSTIVRLDAAGRVTHVNDAWRRFAAANAGSAALEAGVGLDYLAASRPEPEIHEGVASVLAGAEPAFRARYACHGPAALRWFAIEARRIGADGSAVLIHSDVTAEHLAEARARVRAVAAWALAAGGPLEETVAMVVDAVARELEWEVVASWVPGPDARLHAAVVRSRDAATQAYEQATRAATFGAGEGVPGAAWAARAPRWLTDAAAEPSFVRRELAREAGLRSYLAFPIFDEEALLCVLEFASRVQREPDDALLELVSAIASELGALARRERLSLAERERAAAVARLRTLWDAAQDAMMTLEPPDWRFTSGNPAALRLFGAGNERDFVSRGPGDYSPERQADGRPSAEAAGEAIGRALATGSNLFLWTHRRLGGEVFPATVQLSRVDTPSGAFLLATVRDDTEVNRLRASSAQSERLAAIGTLAAGIAHEINTPIQFVGDSVQFLRDAMLDLLRVLDAFRGLRDQVEASAPSPELVAEAAATRELEDDADVQYLQENVPAAFGRCTEGLSRVAKIVRSMKDFAHPAGAAAAAADLDHALTTTLTIATNEIKYVADVVTELGGLPPVVCHLGELNQVFLNLVVNAAHAMGDVHAASGQRGTLTVRSRTEDADAVIEFADTGGGIPEAIRERIFEPFFTTKAVGKGTGQGLALAWSVITERHGGRIEVESEVGRGTTFRISLPIAGKAGSGAPAA
ncbi:MAG: PAS domain-containing protein [Polyangiaceae bacterium]|nr:PAS domain-containing protein [Polyangiaceae bacterium]